MNALEGSHHLPLRLPALFYAAAPRFERVALRAFVILFLLMGIVGAGGRVLAQTPRQEQLAGPSLAHFTLGHSLIDHMLRNRRPLILMPEQVNHLESLRTQYRKEIARGRADLSIAELELSELRGRSSVDLTQIEAKLKEIEGLRTSGHLALIRATEAARAILTSKQRQRLEALPSASEQPEPFAESLLRQQVQAVLKEQFKDQKVVDIETTAAIANRLLEWAKVLGIAVTVPLGLLGLTLTLLGIKTYADFRMRVRTAQEDIQRRLQEATETAEQLQRESDQLSTGFKDLHARLEETRTLGFEVSSLATRLQQIEEKIAFVPSSSLSADRQKELDASLAQFQHYFQRLGFKAKGGEVKVHVRDETSNQLHTLAYYDNSRNTIVLARDAANETDTALRQYTHHVLMSLLSPEVTRSMSPHIMAIASGLAAYFPCSFNDTPKFASKVGSWNLADAHAIANMRVEAGGHTMEGIRVWGSIFWAIRQAIGKDTADRTDKLLLTAWSHLSLTDVKQNTPATFVHRLLETDAQFEGGKYAAQIRGILQERGFES